MPDSSREPPVFEARRLVKFYGRARGVEDISLSVSRGEVFGFLGPNGAGKTTVIRSALGFLGATSGEVRLFGDSVRVSSDLHHERIGYLPADLRLWSGMTARRISDLMLGIGGGPRDLSRRDAIAARLELDLDRRVKSLSLGNRQKTGILLALQHAPELLILDEPTSGLDPLVRRTVTSLLLEFAAGGGTIIYSSHNLSEVEEICSRVGIMRKGRLVALKTIEEIRAERDQRLTVLFAPGARPPESLPEHLADFRVSRGPAGEWQFDFRGSPTPLVRWLAQFEIAEMASPQVSLEEAFLQYYRDDVAAPERAA